MQENPRTRGPDRRGNHDDDAPEKEYVPAFFSAPEFLARDPADERRSGERRGSGSAKAKIVKPLGADDEPLGGE